MILSWNVTRRCNLSCRHCYRDAGEAGPDELTNREASLLIDRVALAGFRVLIFSGGEPLLREDIYELIGHAASRGLRPVLGTNGTLMDRRVVRRLKDVGLARAGISVDNLDPREHDAFRGAAGAWRKTIAALKACREEGLPFQVHTTVTAHNADGIEPLMAFAAGSGAAAHHIFFLVPTGRGSDIGGSAVSAGRYHSLVRTIARRQKDLGIELKTVCAPQFVSYCLRNGIPTRFRKGCLAGISYCCVLPEGDVHPCPYLPVKAGNVRDTPFDRLWKDNPVFNELRTQKYTGRCGSCAYRTDCGGCRARAFHRSGDYMHEDPRCMDAQAGTKEARNVELVGQGIT